MKQRENNMLEALILTNFMNYMDEQAIPQIYIIPRNSTCTSFFLFCVFDWTPCLQHSWPQLRRVKVNLSPKEFSRINSWPFRGKKRNETTRFIYWKSSKCSGYRPWSRSTNYLPTYLPTICSLVSKIEQPAFALVREGNEAIWGQLKQS